MAVSSGEKKKAGSKDYFVPHSFHFSVLYVIIANRRSGRPTEVVPNRQTRMAVSEDGPRWGYAASRSSRVPLIHMLVDLQALIQRPNRPKQKYNCVRRGIRRYPREAR